MSLKSSRREFLAAAGAAAWVVASGIRPLWAFDSAKPSNPFANDWRMQSAEKVPLTGDALSRPDADVKDWCPVAIPSTVLAGLVANGEYPDLFHGENLKKVPKARFKGAWWYRKEFSIPPDRFGPQAWLYFKGINHRANIWLNGKQIGDAREIVGAYRDFEMNITGAIVDGKNVLAVEVF